MGAVPWSSWIVGLGAAGLIGILVVIAWCAEMVIDAARERLRHRD